MNDTLASVHALDPLPDLTGAAQPTPWFAVRLREKFRFSTEQMLSAQGIEFFSPMTTELRQWSDRRKVVSLPLFAGYLFCRFEADRYGAIVRTLGVIDLVRVGNRLAEVDPEELDAIRRALHHELAVEELPALVVGQRVRVISGPLCDVEGVLLQTRTQSKLVLSISMMQRAVAVQIDRSQVQAL